MLVCREERAKTGTKAGPGVALTILSCCGFGSTSYPAAKPNLTLPKTLEAKLRPPFLLVIPKLFYRLNHVGDLRQDGVLQLRGVGHEGVHRTHATHRSVEIFEEFI